MRGVRAPRGGTTLAAVAFIAALAPSFLTANPACAGPGPHAALVVDTGSQDLRYCVALPDDEVSGLEVITLAGEQHGLAYGFGFGGNAVCMLAGVGPTSDDCFEDYPDFWGYWRGSSGGGWTWSSSGAASTVVTDGDVEGWSWGSGDDAESHPRPPTSAFGSICEQQQPPEEAPDRSGDDDASAPPPARAPVTEGTPQTAGEAPADRAGAKAAAVRKRSPGRRGEQGSAKPDGSPAPTPVAEGRAAPAGVSNRGSGPPAAGLAGLGVAGALAAAGVVLARRRRRVS